MAFLYYLTRYANGPSESMHRCRKCIEPLLSVQSAEEGGSFSPFTETVKHVFSFFILFRVDETNTPLRKDARNSKGWGNGCPMGGVLVVGCIGCCTDIRFSATYIT